MSTFVLGSVSDEKKEKKRKESKKNDIYIYNYAVTGLPKPKVETYATDTLESGLFVALASLLLAVSSCYENEGYISVAGRCYFGRH